MTSEEEVTVVHWSRSTVGRWSSAKGDWCFFFSFFSLVLAKYEFCLLAVELDMLLTHKPLDVSNWGRVEKRQIPFGDQETSRSTTSSTTHGPVVVSKTNDIRGIHPPFWWSCESSPSTGGCSAPGCSEQRFLCRRSPGWTVCRVTAQHRTIRITQTSLNNKTSERYRIQLHVCYLLFSHLYQWAQMCPEGGTVWLKLHISFHHEMSVRSGQMSLTQFTMLRKHPCSDLLIQKC